MCGFQKSRIHVLSFGKTFWIISYFATIIKILLVQKNVYSLIISKFPGVVGVGITLKGSLGRSDIAKVSDLHPV